LIFWPKLGGDDGGGGGGGKPFCKFSSSAMAAICQNLPGSQACKGRMLIKM